jgi:hypothetical protein
MARNKDYDVTGEPSAEKMENIDTMIRILFEELADAGGGAEPQDVALLDGEEHNDTTAGTPVRGDIITAQGASPTWTRLAKGSSTQVLAMGTNEPEWISQSALSFPLAYQFKTADESRTNQGGTFTPAADSTMKITLAAGVWYVRVQAKTYQTSNNGDFRWSLGFSGTLNSVRMNRRIWGPSNTLLANVNSFANTGSHDLVNGDNAILTWEGRLDVSASGDLELKWCGDDTTAECYLLAGSYIAYKQMS